MPDATGARADRPGAPRRRHATRSSTPSFTAAAPRWSPTRRRSRPSSSTCTARATRSSPASTASTTTRDEPRLGVLYELLDMQRVDRIIGQGARPHRRAARSTRSSSCSPAPISRARGLRHVRRRVRRPPDLRRILMPEDYEGHPAAPRLPGRRRAGAVHLQRRAELREVAVSPSSSPDRGLPQARGVDHALEPSRPGDGETHELLTLNIGPHHPATHGVLRLLATLEGEVVRDIKPIIGYVHTGIEKTAEDKAYWKVIPVVERMDYLATTSTRWRSAARSRRCSASRCRRAPSTCG